MSQKLLPWWQLGFSVLTYFEKCWSPRELLEQCLPTGTFTRAADLLMRLQKPNIRHRCRHPPPNLPPRIYYWTQTCCSVWPDGTGQIFLHLWDKIMHVQTRWRNDIKRFPHDSSIGRGIHWPSVESSRTGLGQQSQWQQRSTMPWDFVRLETGTVNDNK